MLDQEHHTGRDRVGGGLRTADKSIGHHFGMELIVIQRSAPLLNHCIDQGAQQRVIRALSQPLKNRLEVMMY